MTPVKRHPQKPGKVDPISDWNAAMAETVTLCPGENEGNGRMTTMPPMPIAETDSLWLWPPPDEPRLISLVPPIHAALVDASIVEDTCFDVAGTDGWVDDIPTSDLLICGLSRTADIGQTLDDGVHGPGDLVVLVRHGEAVSTGAI